MHSCELNMCLVHMQAFRHVAGILAANKDAGNR